MGFKQGSQIRPELNRMDFSPIARGGEAFGQGLAALGAGVGKAMDARKQMKAEVKAVQDMLKNPIFQQAVGQMDLPEGALEDMSMRMEDGSLREQAVAARQLSGLIGGIMGEGVKAAFAQRGAGNIPFGSIFANATDAETGDIDFSQVTSTLDAIGAPKEAYSEARLMYGEMNRPDVKPKMGLEDREQFININPDSPDYGKPRIYGASEESGGYLWVNPDGERIAKTDEWVPMSYVQDLTPSKQTFEKMLEDLQFEEEGRRKLEKLMQSRNASGSGIDFLKRRVGGVFKTVLGGKKKLTEGELAAEEAQKRLNSAIGAFRNEIVGPGIVTEFDAKRIEDALGGALLTGNLEVVDKLLTDIMAEKSRKADFLRTRVEAVRRDNPMYRGEYYEPPKPFVPESTGGEKADFVYIDGQIVPQ